MPLPETPESKIPRAALITGLVSLIPFWFLALSPLAPLDLSPVISLYILNTYGAVALSFVGAIWWGIAVSTKQAPRTAMFCWSIVPALIGWIAAAPIMQADLGLLILIAGFAGQWLLDILLFRHLNTAPWVLKLRTILTMGILASLSAAWWFLI